MTPQDYPISLGFKSTAMPWYGTGGSIGPFHHGIDYACPTGTPLILGGLQIATTGATGLASGAHLHVDKRPIGTNISDRNSFEDPSDWPRVTGVVEYAGEAGSAGNIVVIRTQSHFYRFLHLDTINVKKGQGIMASKSHVNKVFQKLLFRDADPGAISTYSKHDDLFVWNDVANSAERKRREADIAKNKQDLQGLKTELSKLKEQLSEQPTEAEVAKHKARIEQLETQLAEIPVIDEDEIIRNWLSRVVQKIVSFFK